MGKSKKKNITIQIDKKTFPELYNIKNSKLNEFCYKLLNIGYNSYFLMENKYNDNTVMKQINHHTNSIKLDIRNLQDTLKDIDINDNIDRFSDILNELFGISNNSCKSALFETSGCLSKRYLTNLKEESLIFTFSEKN